MPPTPLWSVIVVLYAQLRCHHLMINVPDLQENETNAPQNLYSNARLVMIECYGLMASSVGHHRHYALPAAWQRNSASHCRDVTGPGQLTQHELFSVHFAFSVEFLRKGL